MRTLSQGKAFQTVFHGGMQCRAKTVRATYECFSSDDSNNSKLEGAYAFVAAKRLGNAVYRNRCKRRLRAAAQSARISTLPCSAIFFATGATHDCAFVELEQDMAKLKHIIQDKREASGNA